MSTISSGIPFDANTFNLKPMEPSDIRPEVSELLVSGEQISQCFRTIRDQVVFTSKRVLVVNVQGVTGKKVSYYSYPYSRVQYFGIETAGFLDIDSELVLAFNDGNRLQFDFRAQVDIKRICADISGYLL